jgi:hypothetical protein
MSKEEILQAIRSCARKLKRNPSRRDLRRLRISEEALFKHFGGLKAALESAGLRPSGSGFRQPESAVLLDCATVARKLGKIPTVTEYESRGRFSDMPSIPATEIGPACLMRLYVLPGSKKSKANGKTCWG